MDVQQAIIAFSQSEKIKSGLIWVSQSFEVFNSLSPGDKEGAEKILTTIINMIDNEVHLARKHSEETLPWEEASKHIRMALVMINSGVPHEAVFHLSRALSQITGVGQRSMSFLIEKEMLK